MKSIKIFLLTFCASLAFLADAVEFWGVNKSGSGKLNIPGNWSSKSIPTSQATEFIYAGEVECTAARSFTGTSTLRTTGPLVFNFTSGKKVQFRTMRNWVDDALIVVTNSSQLTINTKFDLSNTDDGSSVTHGGSTLLLAGSGVQFVAASKSVSILTGRGANNTISLAGSAKMTAYKLEIGSSVEGLAESGHSLTIGSGTTVYVKNSANSFIDGLIVGKASYGNVMDVYGTYDQQSVTYCDYCNFYIGKEVGSSNNIATVYSGGILKYKGPLYLGNAGSYNTLLVKNGGTYQQLSTTSNRGTFIGEAAGADHNLFQVEAGATISTAKPIYVGRGGSYNTFDYENPTYLPSMEIGTETTSCGNRIYLHGNGSQSFSGSLSNCVFGAGTGNRVTFENFTFNNTAGAAVNATKAGNELVLRSMTFNTSGNITWGSGANDSTYIFDNTTWNNASGSTVSFPGKNTTLRFQHASSADLSGQTVTLGSSSADNGGDTIEVSDGSQLTFSALTMYNSNNSVTISNSTLNINQSFANLTAGTYATNLVFRFEGETPKLANTTDAVFSYTAGTVGNHVLEYMLPGQKYATAPFQAKSITLPKTMKVHVNLVGKMSSYYGEYVLAEATGSASSDIVNVTDITELGSELPSICKLVLSDNKKQLLLKFLAATSIMVW